PAAAGSCSQRDSHFADARRLAVGERLAARGAIGDHQVDGVFCHRQRLAFILPVSDDLRKRRNAHREPALVFRLKHDGKGATFFHGRIYSMAIKPIKVTRLSSSGLVLTPPPPPSPPPASALASPSSAHPARARCQTPSAARPRN